ANGIAHASETYRPISTRREASVGRTGVDGLEWSMDVARVRDALQAAGWQFTERRLPPPPRMENPDPREPPIKHDGTMFDVTRGDTAGTIEVWDRPTEIYLKVPEPVTDAAIELARGRMERAFGAPAREERATTWSWTARASRVEFRVASLPL